MIKFILFGNGSAAALGHALFTGAIPRVRSGKGITSVEEAVVLDSEIHGDDNRDALAEIWRSINKHQPLLNSMGVTKTTTTLQLASEQSEPLLLLADYVAGIVHAGNSHADVLQRSKVTAEAAAKYLRLLRQSGKLIDFSNSIRLNYFQIYPRFKNIADGALLSNLQSESQD